MTTQAPPPLPPGLADTAPGASMFRTLPYNVEAEKALLGAIFANNRAYERVSEFLLPDHFAFGPNARVFEACSRLIERGQIADPVTLRQVFEHDQTLTEIGGIAYLAELAASAVGVINAGEYGRLIHDLHLRRELINLGEEMVERAYSAGVEENATGQIERAEQGLYDLATRGAYEGGFQAFERSVISAINMAEQAHRREGAYAGAATGFADVDKLLGGLHPSDLIILAGRPAMGKTALATNIAFNAAYTRLQSGQEEGAVVGFFSLEMSAEQLASRILSEQTNISSDRMRKGELSNAEFDRLVVASQALHQTPIFIDDTPALTVSGLRTRARRLKRQHGLDMIVVDYLQLISSAPSSRNDGRVQEVAEITRGLKTLAKELNVPVLALSQLSRAVEQRDNKRPQLADLRESGAIEQDADVVMFIFREEYYLERDRPAQRPEERDDNFTSREEKWQNRLNDVRNIAEVIVAKQRHGPTDTVKLHFEGAFTRFRDLDRTHGRTG